MQQCAAHRRIRTAVAATPTIVWTTITLNASCQCKPRHTTLAHAAVSKLHRRVQCSASATLYASATEEHVAVSMAVPTAAWSRLECTLESVRCQLPADIWK